MDQLTVRGIDEQLSASVRRLSKRQGISLNQAALKLLRKGAGLSDGRGSADTIGPALDHLIGAWTPAEADELDSALQAFETVEKG